MRYDSAPLMIMAAAPAATCSPGSRSRRRCSARGWRVIWLGTAAAWRATSCRSTASRWTSSTFRGVRGKGLKHTLIGAVQAGCARSRKLALHLRAAQAGRGARHGRLRPFPGGLMARAARHAAGAARSNADRGAAAGEQDARAVRADACCSAFPPIRPRGRQGRQWTGNPVREDIAAHCRAGERYRRPQRAAARCWSSAAAWAPRR